MSRFFFDSFDGQTRFEDRDGVEFSEDREAEEAAVSALVSIARDSFTTPSSRAIEMVVRDSEGKPILACSLSLAVRRPE